MKLTMIDDLVAVGAIKQEGSNYILANIATGEVYAKNEPFTSIEDVEAYIIAHLYVRTELKKLLAQLKV